MDASSCSPCRVHDTLMVTPTERDTVLVARRALLIGSETYGLQGCNADVALMHDVLEARGIRRGRGANRHRRHSCRHPRRPRPARRIDHRSDRRRRAVLLGSRGPGRATRLRRAPGRRRERPLPVRGAVRHGREFPRGLPGGAVGGTDLASAAPDGCLPRPRRGSQRHDDPRLLSLRVHGTRALPPSPRSVDLSDAKMFRMRGIREHALALTAEMEIHGLTTNPHAVRLVACQPEQSAFEFPSARGGRHGALTDALASVLEELGDAPVSWSVIGELVRGRVRASCPNSVPMSRDRRIVCCSPIARCRRATCSPCR